jgi:hypothetical protein
MMISQRLPRRAGWNNIGQDEEAVSNDGWSVMVVPTGFQVTRKPAIVRRFRGVAQAVCVLCQTAWPGRVGRYRDTTLMRQPKDVAIRRGVRRPYATIRSSSSRSRRLIAAANDFRPPGCAHSNGPPSVEQGNGLNVGQDEKYARRHLRQVFFGASARRFDRRPGSGLPQANRRLGDGAFDIRRHHRCQV